MTATKQSPPGLTYLRLAGWILPPRSFNRCRQHKASEFACKWPNCVSGTSCITVRTHSKPDALAHAANCRVSGPVMMQAASASEQLGL